MKIYYLKWTSTGAAPADGVAYTDKERAENHAAQCNKHKSWVNKLFDGGHQWVVGTLNLKEGPKDG